MGLWQIHEDGSRLDSNNKVVRSLAKSVAGARAFVEFVDSDLVEDVLGLELGALRITLDYLNVEGAGFSIEVRSAGEYLGSKSVKAFPHLRNTISKLSKLSPVEIRQYLAGKQS